ncbi:MAG: VOC family protein [Firmicutes bacterium]|nr:VOC family protein [Bacillota bacterium]
MNISWTTIFVKDIEKSLAFYNGLLGLPVAMKFYGEKQKLVMLGDENNAKVELLENPNVNVSAGNDTISMGFEVESLEEMTKKLTEAGFPVLRGPVSPNEHITFSFFRDPDGYKVQISESH